MLTRRLAPAILPLALLASCTVGPEYVPPVINAPEAWQGGRTIPESERPITTVPTTAPLPGPDWWSLFNDPTLSDLVDRAASGNLSVAQAAARVRRARGALRSAGGAAQPQVDASASAERSRTPSGPRTSNSFVAGFDASWEIDIFGGVRRGVEAADADLEAAIFDQRDILVTLQAEVARVYLELRGAQRQLALARQNFDAQRETLDLTQQRLEAGFVSALDVANAKANVTQTESQIPAFEAQVQADAFALAVLLGQAPGALHAELLGEDQPAQAQTPPTVPVGLPSEMLERRPDLRRAAAELHAATARVGVAVADQYPRFFLTGSAGLQGGTPGAFASIANHFWSFGPAASVPIFTGGRIRGNIDQARAAAEEATLAYRERVLLALQDVETSLVNFTREQQRRAALADAAAANAQAVDLALQLYSAGRTDFLNVLSAQREQYATQSQFTQSDTAVLTNLVALYKALGGGWMSPPSADASSATAPRPRPVQTAMSGYHAP